MPLDPRKLTTDMLAAAQKSLGPKWPQGQKGCEEEFKKIAQAVQTIESGKQAGRMNDADARTRFGIQKSSAEAVICDAVGEREGENAVAAALNAVKPAVNAAARFTLIP